MNNLLKFSWVILIAFLYSISWLITNHIPPWLGFHSDAVAGLISLLLSFFIFLKAKEKIHWHTISLLSIILFIIIWIQFFTGLISQFGVAWTQSLYILGFSLSLLIGSLWERSNTLECADFLFLSCIFGATISLAFQIHQWLDMNLFGDWVLAGQKSRPYANMAQPNQLGTLFFLGIVGCGWFFIRGKFNSIFSIFLATGLLFGLALTQSRTGWVNAVFTVFSFIIWRNRLTGKNISIFPILLLSTFYIIFIFTIPYINSLIHESSNLLEVRSLVDHARLSIWKMLLEAAWLKPWVGYGWGQVSHAQFMPEVADIKFSGNLQQSHNLVLDLILWNGIILGGVTSLVLAWWGIKVLRKISSIEQLLMVLFLMVIFNHAMLEFPLQYAYFLIPTGMMIGAINSNLKFPVILQSSKIIGLIFILSIGMAFSITVRDYFLVENSFYGLRFEQRKIASNIPKTPPDTIVLTQLRDYIIFARIEPQKSHSAENIKWAEDIVKTLPSALGMYKLAAIFAFAGNTKESHYWMKNACKMTNEFQCEIIKERWQQESEIYPAMKNVGWMEK